MDQGQPEDGRPPFHLAFPFNALCHRLNKSPGPAESGCEVRLDRWLWAARFFKTRVLSISAVEGGKVRLNGAKAKKSKAVHIGDEVRVNIGVFEHVVIVRGLAEKRGSAKIAATLYEETTESAEARAFRNEQVRGAPVHSFKYKGKPSKKDRRNLDKFREK